MDQGGVGIGLGETALEGIGCSEQSKSHASHVRSFLPGKLSLSHDLCSLSTQCLLHSPSEWIRGDSSWEVSASWELTSAEDLFYVS